MHVGTYNLLYLVLGLLLRLQSKKGLGNSYNRGIIKREIGYRSLLVARLALI
jgi:hypothetical protein